jgi:hypothetical protein
MTGSESENGGSSVADEGIEVWCRLEGGPGRVRRVDVMHPSGEILLSYPPDRFEPAIIRRMETGQVRGRISASGAGRVVTLRDASGRVLFEEPLGL